MEKILEIKEGGTENMSGYDIVTNKQVIKLLIADHQSCCETWGYFMSEDNFEDFINATLVDIKVVDTELKTYQVDELSNEDTSIMFVNIYTSNGVLQFVAYNQHNGYYGHEAKVISEQLQYSDNL